MIVGIAPLSVAATVVPISTAIAISAASISVSAVTVSTVVAITPTVMAAMAAASVALARRSTLKLFVLFLDVRQQVLAKLFGLLDHLGVWARYVQIHVLLSLTACCVLDVARSSTFNLHTASCLLLNVFHIRASMADDLCAKVETRDRLKVDGNLLLGPFALEKVSISYL